MRESNKRANKLMNNELFFQIFNLLFIFIFSESYQRIFYNVTFFIEVHTISNNNKVTIIFNFTFKCVGRSAMGSEAYDLTCMLAHNKPLRKSHKIS